MSTSSPQFFVLLTAVVVLLPLLPRGSARITAVAMLSCAWYALFDIRFLAILAVVSGAAWAGALAMPRAHSALLRRAVFASALAIALLPLLLFKYILPAAGGATGGWTLASIALPVGISFYSLQAAAYLIDVFVGVQQPEPSLSRFAAFMSFFPHLTAGPIARGRQLLPQLPQLGEFDAERSIAGARSLLVGFFMKIVIADSLAPLVERVYAAGAAASATDLALASTYFSFQVYADFAGYSLMAIGAGRLLGVELPQNFKQPFLSQSLPEYWRTWHITLSAWVRDYILTPLQLQFRRAGAGGLAVAMVVTFVAVGLWHGGAWKYFWFGVIHGVLVWISTLTARRRTRFWLERGIAPGVLAVGRAVSIFVIVTLTFVLFRASSTTEALAMYLRFVSGPYPMPTVPVLWPMAAIGVVVAGDLIARRGFNWDRLSSPTRWLLYHAATSAGLVLFVWRYLSGASVGNQFIYYRF